MGDVVKPDLDLLDLHPPKIYRGILIGFCAFDAGVGLNNSQFLRTKDAFRSSGQI